MAKFTDVISALTECTDPQGDSDYIVGYDGSTVVKYLINNLPFATSTLALDELGAPSDSTSLNASTDTHGLLPKLDGTVTNFLTGIGTWAAAGAGGGFTTGDIHMVELHREKLTTDGNFDVSSISQDYDHLIINGRFRSSNAGTGDTLLIFLNNDTTAGNYKRAYLVTLEGAIYYGSPDDAALGASVSAGGAANSFTPYEIIIQNYSSTDYLHQIIARNGQYRSTGATELDTHNITWEASGGNAVNRITIIPDGYPTDKLVTGSFLQIIGVKTEA